MSELETDFGKGDPRQVNLQDGDSLPLDLEEARDFVVPILKQDLNTGKIVGFIGTGFMVTTEIGLLITAKHNLEVAFEKRFSNQKQKYGLIVIQVKNGVWMWRPIVSAQLGSEIDLGLARCKQPIHVETKTPYQNKVPVISKEPAYIGEHIFTMAYPAAGVEERDGKTWVGLPLEVYPGYIRKHHSIHTEDEYVRKMVSLPCYETSIQIHSGASGGPVFNSQGKIIGINHRAFSFDPNAEPLSWLLRIQDIFDLRMDDVTPTIRELIQSNMVAYE